MAGTGPQDLDRRQAWYAPAYLDAICSQAGYRWQPTSSDGDVHSFDGTVAVDPGAFVSVQVKCRRKPMARSATYKIKPAWRKNWKDLPLPAFLVLVIVPADVSRWVQHGDDQDKVPFTNHSTGAYWTRIDPVTPDKKSVQVVRSDRLTVDTIEHWRAAYYDAVQGYRGGGAV